MSFDLSGIIVLTGLPGAGKTLYMMQIAERAVQEGRPVFHNGINGMSLPGVQEWPDPHAWKDLPPRAVLLVDEAQDHFRTRPGSVTVPKSISDMERIRHSGICMVLTTQQPTYLDKHLRGLSKHHHIVEVLSGRTSNVYHFRSVREDITPSSLNDATFELWQYPRHLYRFYTSAEVHTKKLRIPKRFYILGAGAAFVIAFMTYAFWPSPDTTGTDGSASADLSARGFLAGPDEANQAPLTQTQYAMRFLPRFPTMPQSAPAYDDRPVVAEPTVACMSSAAGQTANGWKEASVTCLTEQGTVYEMREGEARRLARHGPVYDPYKRPEDRDGGAGAPPAAMAAPAAALALGVIPGAQMNSYGDIGITPNPTAP